MGSGGVSEGGEGSGGRQRGGGGSVDDTVMAPGPQGRPPMLKSDL